MKVAVVCECSRVVASAFEAIGWEAISIDILPAEVNGGHIQADVRSLSMKFWKDIDLVIAHPPCTFLSSVQNRWLHDPRYAAKRIEERAWAAFFFLWCYSLPVKKICVENPVGYMNSHFRKPDQIIQPFQFGDPFPKRTCLWLRCLEKLQFTNIVEVPESEWKYYPCGSRNAKWYHAKGDRSKNRSKTFPGIAAAMARQWGAL